MAENYLIYKDLSEKKGVTYSRVHLARLMARGVFPPAVSLSENRQAWRESDIDRYLSSRPTWPEPPPVLWPPREKPPAKPRDPAAKPVGRPKGSRIVRGDDGRRRLVRPEAADAA